MPIARNLRDIAGRRQLAERAARRAELDGLVFTVARRALDATLADVKEALPGVLAQLGQRLRAGRVDVVLFDTATGGSAGDETFTSVGANYWWAGLNANVKAAYSRISPKGLSKQNEFTVQFQVFYF